MSSHTLAGIRLNIPIADMLAGLTCHWEGPNHANNRGVKYDEGYDHATLPDDVYDIYSTEAFIVMGAVASNSATNFTLAAIGTNSATGV